MKTNILMTNIGKDIPDLMLVANLEKFKDSVAVLMFRAFCNANKKHKDLTIVESLIMQGEGDVKLGASHPVEKENLLVVDVTRLTVTTEMEHRKSLCAFINDTMPTDTRTRCNIGYSTVVHYPINYGALEVTSLGAMIYRFFEEAKEYVDGGLYIAETHDKLVKFGEDCFISVRDFEGREMKNIRTMIDETMSQMKNT